MNGFLTSLFGVKTTKQAFGAIAVVVFLIIALAGLKKPGGDVENVKIAPAGADLSKRFDFATEGCQTAVQFAHRRASLGWPASAQMPDGSLMVRQPFTLGKVTHTARCTLRPDGSFEVETEEGFGLGVL